MKKRVFGVMLAIAFMFSAMPFAAHGEDSELNVPYENLGEIAFEQYVYDCDSCGNRFAQYVPSDYHDFSAGRIVESPECGVEVLLCKCQGCGENYYIALSEEGHSPILSNGKEPSCAVGYAEGSVCRDCDAIIDFNELIPASGEHDFEWVIDSPSSCKEEGVKHEECKTDGCAEIRNENTPIEILSHTPETIKGEAASCTKPGLTDGSKCSVCDTIIEPQSVIPQKLHTPETIKGEAASCTKPGLTDGSKCSVCDTIIEPQSVIPKKNHTYATAIAKATLSKNGSVIEKCTECGSVASSIAIKYAKTFKLSATSYAYNGKAKKPSVKVYDSAKKLISASNYSVSYKNNKNVGKATVTVTFKGNYSGTKTLTFTINPKATSVSKLTAAKKSLKVKIKKQTTQTTGYEIQYSTSKKFKSAKKVIIKKAKTTSATIKKLKAKKTYYVRVRTYKTVNGKKYYSTWSKYKYKKTK